MRNSTTLKLAAIAAVVAAAGGGYVWYAAKPGGPRPVEVPKLFKPAVAVTQKFWAAHVRTVAEDGLADPYGVAVDEKGNVFVADGGDSNRIIVLAADGSRHVLAGGAEGFKDGVGAQVSFNTPSGLALDRKGNLYVADTGNHAIRKVAPDGTVTTLAGSGVAGAADGKGAQAQFNGPVGVAVDVEGVVYVADTYNDRVRKILPDGTVSTLVGGRLPGFADGVGAAALFDTPTGIAVMKDGTIVVADARNHALRRVGADGAVTTIASAPDEERNAILRRPVALSATQDGYLYIATNAKGRVLQLTPSGELAALTDADHAPNPAIGAEGNVHLFGPRGLAVARDGSVIVTDATAQRIVRLSQETPLAPAANAAQTGAAPTSGPADGNTSGAVGAAPGAAQSGAHPQGGAISTANAATVGAGLASGGAQMAASDAAGAMPAAAGAVPRAATGRKMMPWPVMPQDEPHEVVGLMGEVRGSYDGENRDHFHAGLDVQAPIGTPVHVIENAKVIDPLANWAFGSTGEGINLGTVDYIHMRVGRNAKDKPLDARFQLLKDEHGKPERVRVQRGTRFAVGDTLGTVNKMAHVHLDYFERGMLINPLTLPFPGIQDTIAPEINSITLLDPQEKRLPQKKGQRLHVARSLGAVTVVVDAFDQMDGNQARRRLGLYQLGYQILQDDKPLKGFEKPVITQTYNKLPRDREAVKVVYAPNSGITVYGSKATHFAYALNSTLINGEVTPGVWKVADLKPGDYTLRIYAADFAGNTAKSGRDLQLTIE
ncbi:gluconolaconase [Pseudoduganella sp. RAF53_2]|uniref:gluconolaconase n=1 Tax=Pseudoduganella sp. RAF53_2 TaxID=3233060 RepID=UPI003F9BAC4F